MIIGLAIAIPGITVLLVAAFAGLVGSYGRTSTEKLIAPRNAQFGEASRLLRDETTQARARADLAALTSRKTDRALVLLIDGAPKESDQRAA